MTRGRIKRILLPYLVRHTLCALIGLAIVFIVFLMFRLVSTLSEEIRHMSDQQHQLSTEQVLYYIRNFLMLALFGSLQMFGLWALIRASRNMMVAFGSALLVAFLFTLIDHLLSTGYLALVIYLLVQATLVFLYLYLFTPKQRPTSHIHYIPMPDEESASFQQSSPSQMLSYKYFRF